jgi:hypothetical protein
MSGEGEAPAGAPLGGEGRRGSLTQRFGTSVPRLGLSPAGLRAFVAQHAGSICQPAAEELANTALAPVALRFEDLTTFQVVARVIKPATTNTAGAYAELLLQQARCARSPVLLRSFRGKPG